MVAAGGAQGVRNKVWTKERGDFALPTWVSVLTGLFAVGIDHRSPLLHQLEEDRTGFLANPR